MDKVVQQVAASTEESASASEEMSAQAEQMRSYVNELVALVGVKARQSTMTQSQPVHKRTVDVKRSAREKTKVFALPAKKTEGQA